ncbi:alpha/beta hydrolase [Filobacillus milosensis]|uniref:Alpha/beta hydrolase n=1 Tax=Filobacillus milosensis TaxID=94137 RepID=A0A4Y8IG62_9BACI|nr:alpha/beta hydrolase [Filobacillus milosensis]TFB13915.1 alpha/beta hydrolase [Filobacillus milosensis]
MEYLEKRIKTERLDMFYLEAGSSEKPPLFLIHGNVSSSQFFDETIEAFTNDYFVIAPDLRGFGQTERVEIDATRGLRDWSDDLKSLKEALQIDEKIHFVGWSVGGAVVMQYAIDYPKDVASLVLENPMSPYGFGGTGDEQGTPYSDSFVGSGGGTANPDFVKLLSEKSIADTEDNSPRNVMNQFYFKPPFRVEKEREDRFVKAMVDIEVGDGFYPGNVNTCEEWPGVAPGEKGINNAISPKYVNLSEFADVQDDIPVLWIRGDHDMIVSDQSFLDIAFLGKQGFVPGWPGDEFASPQPMVSQMRHVLDKYKHQGGFYEEYIINDCGHSPHIEKADQFNQKVREFFENVNSNYMYE